ncbi:hypothetical protein Tco_1084826 [Tanacetum coccineum]
MAGDGVASIKRRRRDQSSDGVRIMATVSGRGRLKEDLESSTWRRRQEHKATPSRRQLYKYKFVHCLGDCKTSCEVFATLTSNTQHVEEPVATVDASKSVDASESEEELRNQTKLYDFEKIVGSILVDQDMTKANSDLELMLDDEIESISGFEADDDDEDDHSENKVELSKNDEARVDNVIKELVDMVNSQDAKLNASADKPAESNPLGHLQDTFNSLFAKVKNLESSLSQRGDDKIDESVPRMVADAIEERLPKLLSDTLKNILLDLLKDSVKNALPKFGKGVKKILKAEVDDLIIKPLHTESNALNTLESRRFITLQKQLTKAIHSTVGKSVQRNVKKQISTVNELLRWNAKNQIMLIKYLEEMVHSLIRIPRDIMVVNAKQLQSKVEKNATDILELVNLIRELVSMIDPIPASPKAATEGENVSSQPKSDQVKENKPTAEAQGEQVINDSTNIEVSAPAHGEHGSFDQSGQTSKALVVQSSEEPHVKKLKVVLDEIHIPFPTPLNSFRPPVTVSSIPYDQFTINLFSSGSSEFSPIPPLKFSASGKGRMTLEDAKAQMEEMKMLADLKAKKEKFEKKKRVPTAQELKAHAEELAAYEAKRAKMLKEYNYCISFINDPLPITKISYKVKNSTKEAIMRITMNNQPLNYKIYDTFVLKLLGFSEWLEVFDVASKNQNKSNDQLLKNLKAKFQWVATQARKFGIPPSPELTAFEFPSAEKKLGT